MWIDSVHFVKVSVVLEGCWKTTGCVLTDPEALPIIKALHLHFWPKRISATTSGFSYSLLYDVYYMISAPLSMRQE